MALDNFRTIELIWDKANKSIIKTIKTASSDTTGRYLSVKILDGGQEVTLNNAKLQLYWEHPNFNTRGTDDFNTVNNGGLFKMTFSKEMLTNIGELNAHLVLILTDGKITSDGFPIEVIKGADDGVVVPANSNGLVKQIEGKIDKGNVTLNDLTQEVKLAMTGGAVAVVGENSVNTVNLINGAVTLDKTSGVTSKVGNIYDRPLHNVDDMYVDVTGQGKSLAGWSLARIPVTAGETLSIQNPIGNYSGDIGAIGFIKNEFYGSGYLSSYIYNPTPSGEFHGIDYITITVPAEAQYMLITTRRATAPSFDYRDDLIVVRDNQLTNSSLEQGISKIFNLDIIDGTLRDELGLERARIDALNQPYLGTKIAIIGDSLTEINSRSTKFYHQYISDKFGIEFVNLGVGGTGYKRQENSNNAFYQRVSSVPLDVDAVILFGSFNDLGGGYTIGDKSDTTTATIAGTINVTLDNIFNRIATVPVGVISPTPWQAINAYEGSVDGQSYVQLLSDICHERGIPFLDLYHNSGLKPWEASYRTLMYSRDDGNGVHPDENGHKLFYPQVREFIKTLI